MAEQTHAELAAEIRGGSMEDRAWMIDALDRAAAALEAMAAPTHDHASEPKLWCVTHQHVHIARVPRFTYLCKDCGWGQWYGDQAREHEFWTQENLREAHTTYEVEHEMIPIVEAAPSVEEFRDLVAAEQARHAEKGYTPEHDRECGADHLLNWAIDYARRGEPVKNASLIQAARAVLAEIVAERDEGRRAVQEIRNILFDPTSDYYGELREKWNAALEAAAAQPAATDTPESDRHALELTVGAVVFNASNHPNPTAVLGQDIAPLRSKIVNAVLAAGFGRGQATEWGTRHPDGPIHPWRDYREAHWRERVLGEPLVCRQVSAWQPVVSGIDRG